MLFSLHSPPVADIVRAHDVAFYLLVDNTQLYRTCSSDETPVTIARVEASVSKIKDWLVVPKLQLNDDKTVILKIRSSHSESALGGLPIKIGEQYISASDVPRDLDVLLDCHFNMTNHIK